MSSPYMTPNAAKKSVPAYTTSAVIPTRNRPELVCRAIESVLRQTSADIEIALPILRIFGSSICRRAWEVEKRAT